MSKQPLLSGTAVTSAAIMIATSAAHGLHPQVTKQSAADDLAQLDRIVFGWDSGQRVTLHMSPKGKRIKAITQVFAPDVQPSVATVERLNKAHGTKLKLKDDVLTLTTDVDTKLIDMAVDQSYLAQIVDTLLDPRLAISGETDHFSRIQPFMAQMLLLSAPLEAVEVPDITDGTQTVVEDPVNA